MGPGTLAGRAYVEIGMNDGMVSFALKLMEARLRAFGDTARRAGMALLSIGGSGAGLFGLALKKASDANEVMTAFRLTFGSAADSALGWADKTAEGLGRGKTELRDSLTSYQAFFRGLGFGTDQAAAFSQQMAGAALDLASFRNLEDSDAQQRFISAMSGSVEVLDKFGIDLHEASINSELMAMGLNKTTAKATEQEKVMARMRLIFRAMRNMGAIGNAAREVDTFGSQLKRVKGLLIDAAEAIGAQLLPTATQFLTRTGDLVRMSIEWIKNNSGLVQSIALVTLYVGGAGAALLAMGAAASVAGSVLSVIWMGLTTALGPLSVMTAALAYLGYHLLYVGDMSSLLGDTVTGAFSGIVSVIEWAINGVSQLLGFGEVRMGEWSAAGVGAARGLGANLQWLLGEARSVVNGIVEAFRAGHVEGAVKVLWAGIKLAWVAGVDFIQDSWARMFIELESLVDSWMVKFRTDWQGNVNYVSQMLAPLIAQMSGLSTAEVLKQLEGVNAQELDNINGQRERERQGRRDKLNEENPALTAAQQELTDALGAVAAGVVRGRGAAQLAPTTPEIAAGGLNLGPHVEALRKTSRAMERRTEAALYGSTEAAKSISGSVRGPAAHQKKMEKHAEKAEKQAEKQTQLLQEIKDKKEVEVKEDNG